MTDKIIFLVFLFAPFWCFGQLKNPDFENWAEVLEPSPYEDALSQMGVKNPMLSVPKEWSTADSPVGVCRIENKCSGEYGLLLFSWYYGEPASLQTTISLDSRPTSIQGCYHYHSADTLETGYKSFARIALWNKTDTVGSAYFSFDIAESYRDFEIPISYTSELVPDSMSILFYTDVLGSTPAPADGLLFLDNLSLVNTVIQSTAPVKENDFEIYPNPFENNLYIDCKKQGPFSFELFDLKGQLFSKGELTKSINKLDIEFLPRGVYILNVVDSSNEILTRKFIKV